MVTNLKENMICDSSASVKHVGCCEKERADVCLPAVPYRVVYDAGWSRLFPRQGTIKEDHARIALCQIGGCFSSSSVVSFSSAGYKMSSR